ncbi:MAG: isoamylase early set domain-containing protein [Nitrospira sp.]|nr:isoamylase early set domain-containing protein [Nitrospira sp.]
MPKRDERLSRWIFTFGIAAVLLTGFEGCAARTGVKPEQSGKSMVGSVRFTFQAQDAKHVSLVGSFNGWSKDASPMKTADGATVWMIDLPLEEGEYTFMYLIDGVQWVTPPSADDFVTDEFGHTNGVVIVR